MQDNKLPLCEKYGFTSQSRETRLAMMGLSKENHAQLNYFHEKVIQPYAKNIVNDFYDVLLSFDEIKEFMLQRIKIERLKLTQLFYVKSYGRDFDTAEYFEEHLKVGQIHAQIGLPLSYYQMSFRILDEVLIDYLVFHVTDDSEKILQFTKLISNVSALDMSLAIETYHGKKIHDMSDSIHALINEKESLVSKIDLDELTQVASRSRVLSFIKQNLIESAKNQNCFCVAMIDLDHFKAVNDNYGHIVGDHILKDVAARMNGLLRSHDMLGRFGGEEFIIVLPGSNISIAKQIAERFCAKISEEPFQVNEHTLNVTISIGVTQWKKNDGEPSLLGRADNALYEAKHQGRNRVMVME